MKLNLSYQRTAAAAPCKPVGVKVTNGRVSVVARSSSDATERASFDNSTSSTSNDSSTFKPHLITNILKEPSKMKRRGLMAAGAAAMFGCACCSDILGSVGSAEASPGWSYREDGTGPEFWPDSCLTGRAQSPIDISLSDNRPDPTRGTIKFPVGPLEFNYGRYEKVSVLNTGHGTMQVNFQPGNSVTVPKRYVPTKPPSQLLASRPGGACLCPTKPFDLDLIQYHFHTPSEHAIDGKRTAIEAHLVHRNKATGGLAVVAVLMQPGGVTPNPCLQLGLDLAPREGGAMEPSAKTINPALLLPRATSNGMQPYVHYTGSLTTPPCSEGVDFFVLTTPIKITDAQVLDFMRFAGNGKGYARNSRPLQPLNGRTFEQFEASDFASADPPKPPPE